METNKNLIIRNGLLYGINVRTKYYTVVFYRQGSREGRRTIQSGKLKSRFNFAHTATLTAVKTYHLERSAFSREVGNCCQGIQVRLDRFSFTDFHS